MSRAFIALAFAVAGCAQIGSEPGDDDRVIPPPAVDVDDGAGPVDAGPLDDAAPPGGDPDLADAAPPPPVVTIDRFEDGSDDGWTRYGGSFSIAGGVYQLANVDTVGKSSWITPADDLTVELDVRFDQGDGDAGAIFRATQLGNGIDQMNGYYAAVNVSGDVAFIGRMDGSYTRLGSETVTINRGSWYHLKIVASGSQLRLYVNDMAIPKVVVFDGYWDSGAVGVRTYLSASSFDNVTVSE